MMCVGAYMPDSRQILSVREEIMLNGAAFIEAIKKSKFELYEENSLRRTPTGYTSVVEPEYQRLLRLRQFLLIKGIDKEFILAPDLPRRVALEFKKGYEFNSLINRCIEYAIENG